MNARFLWPFCDRLLASVSSTACATDVSRRMDPPAIIWHQARLPVTEFFDDEQECYNSDGGVTRLLRATSKVDIVHPKPWSQWHPKYLVFENDRIAEVLIDEQKQQVRFLVKNQWFLLTQHPCHAGQYSIENIENES